MLYAPALYSLRTNSLVRTNDAINGMTSEQLRTGILQRCVSGRLTASYVALFDFTMQQPFRHFCSLSWETHDTQHSAPARWLHPLPPGQQPLITCVVAVIRSPCVVGRGVTVSRSVAVAVSRCVAVAVGRRIAVGRIAVAISVRGIRVIGPCERASDERAKGEAAERRAPPAPPPPGIRRGGRGHCRDGDGGRRGESGQRFPQAVPWMPSPPRSEPRALLKVSPAPARAQKKTPATTGMPACTRRGSRPR